MKHLFFSLCTVFFTNLLYAQLPSVNEYPPLSADAPLWVQKMYEPNPNVFEVDNLFEAYYKQNKKVRNNYIRFYERWRRSAVNYLTPDGYINFQEIETEGVNASVQDNQRSRLKIQTRSAGANWTSMGPHQTFSPGGTVRSYHTNIYCFDIFDGDSNILYAGGENSGAWKTTDKGLNWISVGDNFPSEATSAIEIHPTNSDIVYACSNRYVHKTTDGGNTWTTIFNFTLGIDDIQIHPTNPDILVIGGDSGMRRTTDGGVTWLPVNNMTTWISDIEVNPNNPNEWYCLRKNTTSNLMEFYKSTDAGATWSVRSTGWVTGNTDSGGRMCVTPANAARIYIILLGANNTPILLKSDDQGESWTVINATLNGFNNGQGYYDLSIAASHTNANWLFAGTQDSYRSLDGGSTWNFVGNSYSGIKIHADLQEVKCVGNEIWAATDGGMNLSTDFFATEANFSPRNQDINGFATWGFGQGWQEDVIALSGYHNGTKVMYSGYKLGDNLRIQGGEPATGYVLHGQERIVANSQDGVYQIPTSVSGSFKGLPNLSKYPNEDDYGSKTSEIEFHPTCYKTFYLGKDSAFWQSTDNGATFTELAKFTSKARQFEISRSNPSIIYLATDNSLNRSADGGITWTKLTMPTGCSLYRLSISLSFTDENTLWITSESNGNSNKVFKSTNGGVSWVNMSTTTLNNLKFNQVLIQQGTEGGVYLFTTGSGKAFYRNNSHTDWQDFSTSLPAHFGNLRAIPFYRDNKIRMGGSRGVWQTLMYEKSKPIAQPTVGKITSVCARDTFYFDDYSVAEYGTSTWKWTISPTPQYISSDAVRNPKVVFGASGSYTITLTVTDINGSSTKTINNMVNLSPSTECEVNNTIGKAMSSSGGSDYLYTSAINLNKSNGSNNSTITLMTWVRPNGIQASYTGIITSSDVNVCLNFRNNNELGLHWNNSLWSWTSGLTVPADEWSHIALVADSTSIKLYLNGKLATNTTAPTALDFSTSRWSIGSDRRNTSRTLNGLLDEVCLYNRALSQNEIREQMHLIKNPQTDPALKGYFQFNETSGVVWNKVNANSSSFSGNAIRVTSTAPVATGSSQRMTVSSSGIKNFPTQNINIEFPSTGILPNGEIVVFALNASPDTFPVSSGTPLSNRYWIINNYGTNSSFANLKSIQFTQLDTFATGIAKNFKLFKRKSNADKNTWGTALDSADLLNNSTLSFTNGNNITSFGQLILVDESPYMELLDFNALANNKQVNLNWQVARETNIFQYIIERSADSSAFSAIGTFSKGTFMTIDSTPSIGKNYYRLKIIGLNGAFVYSTIKGIEIPLQITHFNAVLNNKNVDLNWTVNSESTVYQYIIERSTDSTNFTSLKTLNKGTLSFNDTTPQSGANFYRLKVVDSNGKTLYSAIKKVVITVEIPLEITLFNAVSNNKIVDLNWTVNSESTVYQYFIERSSDSINFASIKTLNKGTLSFNDSTPQSGANFYRLKVVDSNGKAIYSAIKKVIITVEIPLEITHFNAVLNNKNVDLNWTVNSESTVYQYFIERSSDSINFASIKTLNKGTLSFNDTTPQSGANFYRLKVVDSNGKTLYSAIKKVVITVEIPLEITLFNAVLNNKTVDLNWTVNSESTVYQYFIERSSDSINFASIKTLNKGTLSFNDTTLQSGANFYRLKAVDSNGRVIYSAIKKVIITVEIPLQITSFNAVLNNKTVDVNWAVNSESTVYQYFIERSTDSTNFTSLKTLNKGTLSFNDTTPQSGANFYRLKVVDSNGKAIYSAIKKVVITVEIPLEITLFNAVLNNKIVDLNWTVNSESTAYQYIIERSSDSINFASIKTLNKGTLSFNDTTPQSGANFYRLKVVDSNGKAIYSVIKKVVITVEIPLEITHFNAVLNNKTVDLNWAVNSENTVYQYFIERSSDSINFASIKTLAKGVFSMTDLAPLAGKSYYRLKIVMLNNSVSYSSIRSIVNNTVYIAPIEVFYFKAALGENGVDLTWLVNNELSVSKYILEYSTDSTHFKTIQELNRGIWAYKTNVMQQGLNYYRLKIISIDGKEVYSPIRIVPFEAIKISNLKIYPNPVRDYLHLQFDDDKERYTEIEIFDNTGRSVHKTALTTQKGRNVIKIDTAQLIPSHYVVMIKQGVISTSRHITVY